MILKENTTVQEVEAFLQEFMFDLDLLETKFNLETGEYGMILLHRLIRSCYKIQEMSLPMDKHQFVSYLMPNGRTLIVYYNDKLDEREGQEIDDETGFPITSSTLSLRKKV